MVIHQRQPQVVQTPEPTILHKIGDGIKYTSAHQSNFEFDFGRVNVLLGANGSGKSRFLNDLKSWAKDRFGKRNLVYIEGGRAININNHLSSGNIHSSSFESIVNTYEDKRAEALAHRLHEGLVVLEKKGWNLKIAHSDAVESWIKGGKNGECPERPQTPLDRLREIFNDIFPKIILRYDDTNHNLWVDSRGVTYAPSSLSDGEKQAFSMLAELIDIGPDPRVIIIDEPELNLHPELSERLWTLIENELTNKIFVYATHSINFALRSNVNRVYVLSSDSANIAEFTSLGELPRTEVTAFLGAIPGILSANKVLVTEGHDKSFDALFYRWLLKNAELEIYAADGCLDVKSTVLKSGLWEKITSRITLFGVIDADYRDDSYLKGFNNDLIALLPYHEAESYLCVPEIIAAVAERIGSREKILTAGKVETQIFSSLEEDRLSIAAQRVFARSHINLGVSLTRKVIASAATRESLVAAINEAAHKELSRADAAVNPARLENDLDSEIAKIDEIIKNRDVDLALRYLPGKELLIKLAPQAGCRSDTDLMRSLKRNFEPGHFAATARLRDLIISKMNLPLPPP